MGLQTNNSLLIILQGEVVEDPDNEGVPVGETFWRLPEALLNCTAQYIWLVEDFLGNIPPSLCIGNFPLSGKFPKWDFSYNLFLLNLYKDERRDIRSNIPLRLARGNS